MLVTPSGCVSVCASAPSATRQSLTVLSGLQLARSCESGLKATRHVVVPACALMARPTRATTAGLAGVCGSGLPHPAAHKERHRTERAYSALENFDILTTPLSGD